MADKLYASIRVASGNNYKMQGALNHDFRLKPLKHLKNNNNNYVFDFTNKESLTINSADVDTNKKKYKNNKDSLYKAFKESEKTYDTLYKQKFKRNRRKERNNALSMGVYTFSNKLTEIYNNMEPQQKKEFIKNGMEKIQHILNNVLKTNKIYYIAAHTDETTPHFHYVYDNYQADGTSCSIKNTRNIENDMEQQMKNLGKTLQDNATIQVGEQIFERGDNINQKHYKNEQSRQMAEQLKQNITILENSINELETTQKKIMEENMENDTTTELQAIKEEIAKEKTIQSKSYLDNFFSVLPNTQEYETTIVNPSKKWTDKQGNVRDSSKTTLFNNLNELSTNAQHIKFLQANNMSGANVYLNTNKNLFLLDDLTKDKIDYIKKNNVELTKKIVAITETSANNYQVLLYIPIYLEAPADATEIYKENNKEYNKKLHHFINKNLADLYGGDLKSCDIRHKFRLPTFTNRKEKHKNKNGLFPFVKLSYYNKIPENELNVIPEQITNLKKEFDRLQTLEKQKEQNNNRYKTIAANRSTKQTEIKEYITNSAIPTEIQTTFNKIFNAVSRTQTDLSSRDYIVIKRLIEDGFTDDMIYSCFNSLCPDITRKSDPNYYINQSITKVQQQNKFDIEKIEKNKKKYQNLTLT